MAELLNHTYRMLLAYYPPIYSHALHVYESAVATMPRCALFLTANIPITAGTRLLSAREGGWNTTLRIIEGPTSLSYRDCVSLSHPDIVCSIAVSPDGKHLASSLQFGPVRICSATTGDQVAVLSSLLGMESIAFSPDGTRIATNSMDGVRLWDTTTYRQIARLRNPHGIPSGASSASLPVVFSPMGKFLVNANIDGTIHVWDLALNIQAWVIQNRDIKVTSVAWSPDGKKIISGSTDGMLRHWDARTGVNVATLGGHGDTVTSLAYSPDGLRLVSGSDDRTIWVWDMRTDEPISVLRGHSDKVTSVTFSPDGRWVISGSYDNTVRVWDVESTNQLVVLQGHRHAVSSVTVSPDGTEIISGSHGGTIRVWDVETLSSSGSAELLDSKEPTYDVVISLDGAYLVSIVDKHGWIWDVQAGEQIATLGGHTDKISDVAFSPDSQGLRIVTGSWDLTVRVWDTQTGRQLAVFEDHGDKVSKVALSPDGTRAVSGASDCTLRVWDVATGGQVASFEAGYQKWVTAVALSPDGLRVVSSYYAETTVWDVDTGAQIALLESHGFVMSIAFSSDSRWLYTTHLEDSHSDWLLELAWDFDAVLTHQHGTSSDRVSPSATSLTTETSLSYTDQQLCDTISLSWNYTTGWLSCVSTTSSEILIPLCWLPMELRRDKAILRGWQAILGGMGGSVTILDFTDAINRLASLGIV
jgi:WD40 repeat protein